MRNRVVSALVSLSDRSYQQRVWIDQIRPHPNFYDNLDRSVHILFDDIDVCLDPEGWVNDVLYVSEVEPLRALGNLFQAVIDDLGDAPDADYLADPHWDDVIRLARIALIAMTGEYPEDLVAALLEP